jgi:hypothetical protein
MGENQLQCVGCHEQLLVQFPACLSATARSKLTSLYEQQLCELHRDSCPFRRDAQNYMLLGNQEKSDRIPALWTQVWRPKEVLELLDPLRPSAVVRERWEKVIAWLESAAIDCKSWKLSPVDETVFQQFAKTEDELLEKCWKVAVGGETQVGDEVPTRSHELELGALLTVLLGWTPDTVTPSGLQCSLCLGKMNLGSLSRDGEQQPKRVCLRVNAPVDSHRYYCPFVRGLPHAGIRFCDRILLRLLNETYNQDKESPLAATEFRLEIRKLLKDVISPSKLSAVSK